MPNPWFRLYSEFEDDPKVQRMPESMQRRLLMLFCARCKEEQRTDEDFAFKWHVTLQDVTETKLLFIEKGFIDDDWNLLNWNRRQFVSDSSAERTRQWRQRTRQNGTSQNVTVTKCDGVDTDTDTDTDTESKTNTKTLASEMKKLIEQIYQAYPRKVARAAALKAIEKAIKMQEPDEAAWQWLLQKTKDFARSPAGNNGNYTPHPATWFNHQRYLDDPKQWQLTHTNGASNGNQTRNQRILNEALQSLDDE